MAVTPVGVFLDTGVLISAVRGKHEMQEPAISLLKATNLTFWYSPFLELEVTLQPAYERRQLELDFYQEYFRGAECFDDLDRIFELGSAEARRHGVAVIDALHIAAASLSRCEYFITTENPKKPLFRTRLLKVITLSESRKLLRDDTKDT